MEEELFIVDDVTTGQIRILNKDQLVREKGKVMVAFRILGKNLKVENWGTSANEELYVKHF